MPDTEQLREATEERLNKYREAILATAAERVKEVSTSWEEQQEAQARDTVLGAIDAENQAHFEKGADEQRAEAEHA